MIAYDVKERRLVLKLVYYGPALSGKIAVHKPYAQEELMRVMGPQLVHQRRCACCQRQAGQPETREVSNAEKR